MARNRGKKALYEVMSKARVKPDQNRVLEHMHPKKSNENEPTTKSRHIAQTPKAAAQWWKKPRIVQFNAGRIEFSMPYQFAVALILILILVLLAAYRAGQFSYMSNQTAVSESSQEIQKIDMEQPTEQAMTDIMQPSASANKMSLNTEEIDLIKSTGNNVIVLVGYKTRADLVPVQTHFAQYGIETEIVMENDRYFLQTRNTYENPDKPGTDGFKVKQKIAEVGAQYENKAPAGYETFAPNFFSDAYGKKVK